MTHEPVPFKTRLQHTIALLQYETEIGMENWNPTIELLKEVLAEEEQKTPDLLPVSLDEIPDWDDDDDY